MLPLSPLGNKIGSRIPRDERSCVAETVSGPFFLSKLSVHGEVGGESIVGTSGVRCCLANGARVFAMGKRLAIGARVFSGLYDGSRLDLVGGVVVGL